MQKEFVSQRKKDLRGQIYQAKQSGAKDYVLHLKAQWVHRYGIETLADSEQQGECIANSTTFFNKVSTKVQDDFIQNPEAELLKEVTLEDNMVLDRSQEVKPDEFNRKENEEESILDNIQQVSPPPAPALSHLRRWLTSVDESLPKAS